eukprot:16287-Eustigmatos_ZCMA.PRE.1
MKTRFAMLKAALTVRERRGDKAHLRLLPHVCDPGMLGHVRKSAADLVIHVAPDPLGTIAD